MPVAQNLVTKIVYYFFVFAERIFSGRKSVQKRSRRTSAAAQKSMDFVPKVSAQLFRAWRVSILLQ